MSYEIFHELFMFLLVQKRNYCEPIFSENFSSLWGLNGRGSPLSSLSELYALPGRACLSCLTPESDKVLVNLAYSCRGACLCLMRVWDVVKCYISCNLHEIFLYISQLWLHCMPVILKFFQKVTLFYPIKLIKLELSNF